MIQGYTKQALYKGQKKVRSQNEDLIIVRGTHDALIDKETFNKVQQINKATREKYFKSIKANSQYKKTENKYFGKIICGCCGNKFKRARVIKNSKVSYILSCSSRYRYTKLHLLHMVIYVIKKQTHL